MPGKPENTIDLTQLKKDELQDQLYDLFVQSFNNPNVNLLLTIVSRKYEMRLDLLCSDLYGSVEYIGALMKINDIFNPFSVKLGDIIFYLPAQRIGDISYTDPKLIAQQKDELVNALKTSTISDDRLKFLEGLQQPINLPPTITRSDASKIVVTNNSIKIAPDLYANPNSQLGISEPTDTGLGDIFAGQTASEIGQTTRTTATVRDDTERVLVSRFVRSGNTIIGEADVTEEENTDEQ